MWYGKNKKLNFSNTYKRRNLNFKRKLKETSFFNTFRKTTNLYKYLLNVPSNWHITFLVNKNSNNSIVYIYSSIYFFKYFIKNTYLDLKFDRNSNLLVMKNFYNSSFYPFYSKVFNDLYRSLTSFFFLKLKIKGKGYYIYKNFRNTITHQFGHSHRTYIYSYYVNVKFLSKTAFFLYGSSKSDIFKVGRLVRKSKYINIFTGRGVRFSRQVVYKKTGKVSSYR